MKCHNCNHNEASLSVTFDHKGRQWSVQLCEDCAAAIWQATTAVMAATQGRGMAAGAAMGGEPFQGQVPANVPEASNQPIRIPAEADPELQLRRRKKELQALLREAVGAEEFEEAARLRDTLQQLEDKVY